MDSDELLVKRILAGDQDAFRQLVDKYQVFVRAVCMNISRDQHDAENLAQETFIEVYRSLSKYQFKGFKTWIGRIATNKSIDWKRKRKSENLHTMLYLDDITALSTGKEHDLQEQLIEKEKRNKLMSLCNSLPEKYSTVLKKYYLQSKSYHEISNEEGISIRTVESRLYRAKKTIRENWEVGE